MKKAILIASVLAVGLWAMSMKSGYCKLEQEATHKAAVPVVEALAAYAKEHGIPNLDSFEQIEGIPYKLKPCSERPDLMECEVLKDGYYFQTNDGFFTLRLSGKPQGFALQIAHNCTDCSYTIFRYQKLTKKYLQPTCVLNGKCAGWFRQ